MQIRLFTSGTHKGLNFSNADIASIAEATAKEGKERIPIVLGHPKNDLPVFGYLPKSAIRTYQEGDKVSLGFDRDAAELAEEGIEAIRSLGRNKISVRLEEGKIKHIGLVKKAAVAENNTQDFSALTGDFSGSDEFCEAEDGSMWENLKRFFKTNKGDFMSTENQNNDFAALSTKVDGLGEVVSELAKVVKGQETEKRKATLTADFSAADFSHLTDEQRMKAVSICERLSPEEAEDYKAILKAGNQKPPKPANGSVTANFGKDGKEDREAEDLIREQVESII